MELPLRAVERGRAADFIEWDVRNWSYALPFWRRHSTQDLARCHALEVGARNGGLSLWLALQGASVVCSDIRPPSQKAIDGHRARGVSHLVRYEQMDAMHIPYTERFDVVLFKSVLGAVGYRGGGKAAQARAIAEMHKALKPGGELFFAENLVGSPIHMFLRQRYVRWREKWRWVSVEEMREFLQPFSQVSWGTAGFAGALGRTTLQRNILGAFDRILLDRITPARWKYIIVGVARK